MTIEKSCWTCNYHQNTGRTLLGFCRWFPVHQNQGAKEIPPHVVDKGCDLYEARKSFPLVPHYHTCRACPERHTWQCQNARCTWTIMLDCRPASSTAMAAPNKETKMETSTTLPKPRYTVSAVNHKYTITLASGEKVGPLKSVTGVIGVIDKPALKGWAARMAADHFKKEILKLGAKALNAKELERIAAEAAKAYSVYTKDAADLGTACHDAFEAIILGRELENLPKELVEPVNAFKNYRLGSDIEVIATELMVASLEHRAGGCLDFLGYSESRGGWGIGDYKTSSGFYGNEYAYQAGGGYALMVEEMYGIEIKWAEIVRFDKKPPYGSEARPVIDVAAAKEGFLECLRLTRRNEQQLIGAPTFTSAGLAPEPKAAAPAPAKKKASPVGF